MGELAICCSNARALFKGRLVAPRLRAKDLVTTLLLTYPFSRQLFSTKKIGTRKDLYLAQRKKYRLCLARISPKRRARGAKKGSKPFFAEQRNLSPIMSLSAGGPTVKSRIWKSESLYRYCWQNLEHN